MLSPEKEQQLIGTIYDAALEPSLWNTMLGELRRHTHARQCNLIFYDRLNRRRNDIFFGGDYPEGAKEKYLSELIDMDIQRAQVTQSAVPTGVFIDHQRLKAPVVIPDEQQLLGFIENEVKEGPIIAAELLHLNYSFAYLSLIRDIGDTPFEPVVLEFMNRIAPHLCRAMKIYHALFSMQMENKSLHELINQSPIALLLIDRDGRVQLANRAAARIMEQHPALRIGHGGRLRAVVPADDLRLQAMIHRATFTASLEPSISPEHVPLSHPAHTHPLKCTLLPLRSSDTRTTYSFDGFSAAVALSDSEREWVLPQGYLQDAYGLTAAEVDIAQGLIHGSNTRAIAHTRGTTYETTRGQIKRILDKTHCTNQVELVRLLISLCADFNTLFVA